MFFLFGGKPDVCGREHGSIAEPFRLNSAQTIAEKRRWARSGRWSWGCKTWNHYWRTGMPMGIWNMSKAFSNSFLLDIFRLVWMIQNYEIFQPEHYHGTFPSWKPCRTPTAKASWMLWSTAPSLRSACQKPQMNKRWIEELGLVLCINHDLAIHKIDQIWGILNSPTNMRMYQTQPDCLCVSFFFNGMIQ